MHGEMKCEQEDACRDDSGKKKQNPLLNTTEQLSQEHVFFNKIARWKKE